MATWERIIGPPWVSNNLSAFIMLTIFVVNFCIWAFIVANLKSKINYIKRKEKKKRQISTTRKQAKVTLRTALPWKGHCLFWNWCLECTWAKLGNPWKSKQNILLKFAKLQNYLSFLLLLMESATCSTLDIDLLPKVPLSTDIRSNPEMNIKACFLRQLNKLDQIIVPLKIILQRARK